jgi:tetraacyldisaccharide 4'-kinase
MAREAASHGLAQTGEGGPDIGVPASEVGMVFRVAGAARARLAAEAVRRLGSIVNRLVVVMDDGFQHFALDRNLDVAMVSCFESGLERAKLFPAGALREAPSALSRAHAVVLAHTDVCGAAAVERTEQVVKCYAPGAVVVRGRHRPVALRIVAQSGAVGSEMTPFKAAEYRGTIRTLPPGGSAASRVCEPSTLAGARIFVFCGIGWPGQFLMSLRLLGAEVVGHAIFPDHHAFTRADLGRIESAALSRRAQLLVTTEKDYCRLGGHSFGLPLGILLVDFEVSDVGYRLEAAIDRVLAL